MNELKPCPFCGSHNLVEGYHSPFVICDDCGAFGPEHADMTHDEAVAAWNSRAERTCNMETDHDELEVIAYSHEDTWAYKCSVCGWSFRYDRGIKPNYCPNCGCKVVSE